MQSYFDNSGSIGDIIRMEKATFNRYESQGGACSADSGE